MPSLSTEHKAVNRSFAAKLFHRFQNSTQEEYSEVMRLLDLGFDSLLDIEDALGVWRVGRPVKAAPGTRIKDPLSLTPKETKLQGLRIDGYSLQERALAMGHTSRGRVNSWITAKMETLIDQKLEAQIRRRGRTGKSGAGRVLIAASEETLAMMRDPNLHPDAIT